MQAYSLLGVPNEDGEGYDYGAYRFMVGGGPTAPLVTESSER